MVALAATVVGAALVAVAPRTAHACVCPPPTGGPDDVDVAFVGRPVAEDYDDPVPRVITEFEVDWVYKGNVGSRVAIHSVYTNCGIYFGEYEDWSDENRYWTRAMRITAIESDEGVLSHGLCRPWGSIGPFEEVFGSGYPPDGSIDLQAPDDGPAPAGGSLIPRRQL